MNVYYLLDDLMRIFRTPNSPFNTIEIPQTDAKLLEETRASEWIECCPLVQIGEDKTGRPPMMALLDLGDVDGEKINEYPIWTI